MHVFVLTQLFRSAWRQSASTSQCQGTDTLFIWYLVAVILCILEIKNDVRTYLIYSSSQEESDEWVC